MERTPASSLPLESAARLECLKGLPVGVLHHRVAANGRAPRFSGSRSVGVIGFDLIVIIALPQRPGPQRKSPKLP